MLVVYFFRTTTKNHFLVPWRNSKKETHTKKITLLEQCETNVFHFNQIFNKYTMFFKICDAWNIFFREISIKKQTQISLMFIVFPVSHINLIKISIKIEGNNVRQHNQFKYSVGNLVFKKIFIYSTREKNF